MWPTTSVITDVYSALIFQIFERIINFHIEKFSECLAGIVNTQNTQNRINTTKTVQNYVHQSMVFFSLIRRFQQSVTAKAQNGVLESSKDSTCRRPLLLNKLLRSELFSVQRNFCKCASNAGVGHH